MVSFILRYICVWFVKIMQLFAYSAPCTENEKNNEYIEATKNKSACHFCTKIALIQNSCITNIWCVLWLAVNKRKELGHIWCNNNVILFNVLYYIVQNEISQTVYIHLTLIKIYLIYIVPLGLKYHILIKLIYECFFKFCWF